MFAPSSQLFQFLVLESDVRGEFGLSRGHVWPLPLASVDFISFLGSDVEGEFDLFFSVIFSGTLASCWSIWKTKSPPQLRPVYDGFNMSR